jgi:hypothetical protein
MKSNYTLPPPSDNRAARRRAQRDQRGRTEHVAYVWVDIGLLGFVFTTNVPALRARLEDEVRRALRQGEAIPPGLALTAIPLRVAPDAPLDQVLALATLPRDVLVTADALERRGVLVRPLTPPELLRLHPLAHVQPATETPQ